MMDAFNSSLLMAISTSEWTSSISEYRFRSHSDNSTEFQSTPLVDVDFPLSELVAVNNHLVMKAGSEKVESEVKLGRVGLSESDGSVAEDVFRSFLLDPACSPSRSTSAFRLAIDRVSIVISSKALEGPRDR